VCEGLEWGDLCLEKKEKETKETKNMGKINEGILGIAKGKRISNDRVTER
jgi:hypothetical protein